MLPSDLLRIREEAEFAEDERRALILQNKERRAREKEREREEEAQKLETQHRRLAEAVRDFLTVSCSLLREVAENM